jgi:hypothetical protein
MSVYQFVQKDGYNNIEAEVNKESVEITVFSATLGLHDDSAGISMPIAEARRMAEWILKCTQPAA